MIYRLMCRVLTNSLIGVIKIKQYLLTDTVGNLLSSQIESPLDRIHTNVHVLMGEVARYSF